MITGTYWELYFFGLINELFGLFLGIIRYRLIWIVLSKKRVTKDDKKDR